MKKITFAILAIAFIAAFNSCNGAEEIQTDDEDDWEYFMKQYDKDTPHTPGTFIMFGANTYYNTGVETRTEYSDEEITVGQGKKERIDWVNGDLIQIYCNQSVGAENAVYKIYDRHTDPENEVQSVAPVTLESAQGLKWGTTDPHIFHGIYPKEESISLNPEDPNYQKEYPKVTSNDDNVLKFTSCVPSRQKYPEDMTLAGMVATTSAALADKGNVSMVFYPIVTTLQFDLMNLSENRDIYIKEISIVNNTPDIAGTYEVQVDDDGTISYALDPHDNVSVYGINTRLRKWTEGTSETDVVRVRLFTLPIEFTNAKLAIKMKVDNGKTDPEEWDDVTRRVALNYLPEGATQKESIVFIPTHKYNFTIKIPESTVFDVTPEGYVFDVPGGAAPLNVTSYTYDAAGNKVPVAWTATKYSIDGGETWLDFGASVLNPDRCGILPTMLEGWDLFNTVDVPEADRQFVTPVNGTVSYNKPPYRALKENTLDSPAVDVDLSMRDVNGNPTSLMNTANCYMVHAGGTYKFPIVYGNAIKNGGTNTIAFNPTMDRSAAEIQDSITYSPYKKTDDEGRWITLPNEPYYSLTDEEARNAYFGTELSTEQKQKLFNVGWGKGWSLDNNPAKYHFLSPFLNHTGQGITDPWLKNNTGVNPTTATLLWQDAKGLIKNVGIEGDYVTFEVTSAMAELVEGNALIAVTDGSTILWSWHIWVTEVTEDQNINSTNSPACPLYDDQTMAASIIGKKVVDNSLPNATDAKIATFLGLCDLSVSPKEIKVKFIQEGTGAEEIVTLTQKGLFDVNAPFYQHGRKDPLRFQKGINGSDRWTFKELYDITGDPVTTSTFNTLPRYDAVYESIKRPTDHCTNNGYDEKYYNLWAARLTRPGRYDAVRADKTKTVYDPCPVGYRVPSLADVAGWAGNNNSDGYHPRTGASRNYIGRIISGWSESTPYAIMNIDGESKSVYVPFLQGSTGGSLVDNPDSWRLGETASWVSTPTFFSCVQSNFKDEDFTPAIQYYWYDGDQLRRTEDFYWYYARHTTNNYNQKVKSHWGTADQSSHQIRFGSNVWMNEPGANRSNAVNVFMVKERPNDTCSDEYHQETQ